MSNGLMDDSATAAQHLTKYTQHICPNIHNAKQKEKRKTKDKHKWSITQDKNTNSWCKLFP